MQGFIRVTIGTRNSGLYRQAKNRLLRYMAADKAMKGSDPFRGGP